MNIKSLLLGSAAALAAVSGAHAADAIVAAEPEPMEYVRVCDAFGTGYFYIPGTETCLKIGGYVRTQFDYKENEYGIDEEGDIDARSKGYLTFEAKSDTEFGALTGYINVDVRDDGVELDAAWINVAGFDVGNYFTWWDDGIAGETDTLSESDTSLNGIRYTYEGGAFRAGAAVEELEDMTYFNGSNNNPNDNIGLSGLVGGTLGGIDVQLVGSYDMQNEEAAFLGVLKADLGPGTFTLSGIYATDRSYFWVDSEWTIAASYEIKATDKLTITPAAQYFGDGFADLDHGWAAGVTAQYYITEKLRTLATVNYNKISRDSGRDSDQWTGFLRLQRDF